MDRLRILVVEDDAITRRGIVRALTAAGDGTAIVDVTECADGDAAVGALTAGAFDCAILDHGLPGRNGLEVLQEARAAGVTTPVIMLTARGDEELAVEAMKAGAADYLGKSRMSPEALWRSVRAVRRVYEAEAREAAAVERLRANEERLARILVTTLEGIMILDRDGRYTFANAASLRIVGATEAEVLGAHYADPPWSRLRTDGTPAAPAEHYYPRVLAAGELVYGLEIGVVRRDGTRRVVSVNATPLRGAGGAIEGVTASLRDITEQKVAEHALRDSEERFRTIFDDGPLGMALVDASLRIVRANAAIARFVGVEPADLVGLRVGAMTHPDDAPTSIDLTGRLVRGEIGSYTLDERYVRKDGRVVWGRLTVSGIRVGADRERFALGMIEDIDARKRAEEALRETAQRLRELVEGSPVAIVSLDPDSTVLSWNAAAERMFGWTAAEAEGHRWPALSSPGETTAEAREMMRRVLDGQRVVGAERRRPRKDGTFIDVNISAAPLRDAAGRVVGVMKVIQDITEAKRLKEQLFRSQRMESIGRLAGGVAHDFNNMLAIISGYSESLLRRIDPDDPLRPHVREIEKAAERGGSLTRQLLAFSRRQVIEPQELDLNRVVAGMHDMLRPLITSRIEIQTTLAPDLARVRADPGQMEQVLVNLAINARDAMPDGGRLAVSTGNLWVSDVAARSRGIDAGWYVRLSVSDTGVGMDAETQAKAFEPFFTTKNVTGTGLGLSIVYGIVQQCGGGVWLNSEPGKGTTFDVVLPRVDAAPPPAPPAGR